MQNKINKRKVFNDPVYGFITIPYKIIFNLIEHPYFQRLRRISQLGLSHLVYPGAHHNRYHHALGACHLMFMALMNLRIKGVDITEDEMKGALIAILLHDIGHGPFSHALEQTFVKDAHHEHFSLMTMEKLNKEFNGKLDLAIEIFTGKYKKEFLHQLVSSQLDVDRLDYLKRDSFYSGVSEGIIGNERIIKMLDVKDNQLVVEEKGIYSIEKFLVARRLMYWQVYLHKTVLVAETLLALVLQRAKELEQAGTELFGSPALRYFLKVNVNMDDFNKSGVLDQYLILDDFDVMGAIKVWQDSNDKVLSDLSIQLVQRRLPKIKIGKTPISASETMEMKSKIIETLSVPEEMIHYYMFTGKIHNNAYNKNDESIKILYKDGSIKDIAEASDNLSISSLQEPVEKYYFIHPRI
ncbi:MAG: HD superfamily phosphohydrolase [Glaciecola sp.]